jgi:hypothetical protein
MSPKRVRRGVSLSEGGYGPVAGSFVQDTVYSGYITGGKFRYYMI